jgi:hypothetical protein
MVETSSAASLETSNDRSKATRWAQAGTAEVLANTIAKTKERCLVIIDRSLARAAAGNSEENVQGFRNGARSAPEALRDNDEHEIVVRTRVKL